AADALRVPGLTVEPLPIDFGTAMFDLTLTVTDGGEAMTGAVEYNTDLYDGATISRMLRHFEALLGRLIAEPERPVAAVPLADKAERRQVLEEWNASAVDYPRDRTVHDLIAEQAARTPGAVALVHAGGALTYGELNERAERVARHLRATGVGPEALVGLCVERSP